MVMQCYQRRFAGDEATAHFPPSLPLPREGLAEAGAPHTASVAWALEPHSKPCSAGGRLVQSQPRDVQLGVAWSNHIPTRNTMVVELELGKIKMEDAMFGVWIGLKEVLQGPRED